MELFKLFGKIAVENDEANKKIKETTKNAEDSSIKFSKVFEKLGSIAVKIGKVVAVGVGAAATAIAGLGKVSLDSYANYEQLVGGVETLFKTSASKVFEYSEEAYRTAGLSANAYMDTITGFSASLIQGLKGDTSKATEIGNRAITDMSDNANKMGTDMSLIQNAYQGFAKQNYTMLDNLKLGYGGTQEEMKRLIKDSSKMKDIQKELGITVNSSSMSFDNIINAISVMQKHLDITGTTAKEASSTIQGSIGMMKGAWENFLTIMGDETKDPSKYLNALLDSIQTVANNIIPRIQIILPRLIEGMFQLVNNLIPQIPQVFGKILPTIVSGAVTLINSLMTTIIPQLPHLVMTLAQTLIENLPPLFEAGKQIVGELLNGFIVAVPILISQGLPMLMKFSGNLQENAGKLIELGIDLIMKLADGLIEGIPTMIETIPTIVSNIANIINENAPKLIVAAGTLMLNLAMGLIKSIPVIIQEIPKIVKAIFDVWSAISWINLGKNVANAIENGIQKLPETLNGIWSKVKNGASSMWGKIQNTITSPISSAKNLLFSIGNGIKTLLANIWLGIQNVTINTFGAIKNAITNPIETAKNVISGIVGQIKSMFNFTVTLPHIKLPHFAITPSGWQVGDLLKGSIPKLGINWYKKAMDEPYMFTKPTLFNYNPMTGNAKGAGEAGDEMIYGKSNLMRDISKAVESSNDSIIEDFNYWLEKMFDLFIQYFPEFAKAPVFDVDGTAAILAGPMDKELGKLAYKKERGR